MGGCTSNEALMANQTAGLKIMANLGNRIVKILTCKQENFSVKLKFADGTVSTVLLQQLFEQPKGLAAEVLRGKMFEQCLIESGALAWPNGLELCPDVVYKLSQKATRYLDACRKKEGHHTQYPYSS